MGRFEQALRARFDVAEKHPQHDVWVKYALGSNERGAELVATLAPWVASFQGLRTLDIGSGYGGTSVALGRAGAHSVGIELDDSLLQLSRLNASEQPGCQIELLPLDAMSWDALESLGQFDVIICDNVIEHVPVPQVVIAHLRRLLKPTGLAWVTAPNAFSFGQLISECHFGRFGLSLLDPLDGAAYLKESQGSDEYGVSDYFTQDGYVALFERYGLCARFQNQEKPVAEELAELSRQREALRLASASAQVPAGVRRKVEVLLAKHLARFDADLSFLHGLAEGPGRDAFTHRLFREYCIEQWCFVLAVDPQRFVMSPGTAPRSAPPLVLEASLPPGDAMSHPEQVQERPLSDRVVSRLRGLGRMLRNAASPSQEVLDLKQQLAALEQKLAAAVEESNTANGPWKPGHFYSPVPDRAEVRRRAAELFPEPTPRTLPGIDLNEAGQLALLEAFKAYRDELPFRPEGGRAGVRGVFSNTMYCGTEGALLYFMMRHLKPKRIVEIGSGYSTCFALDTNELFFDYKIKLTLIEPYTDRLRSLLRPGDFERFELLETTLQKAPQEVFSRLGPNDIVFIDSTHVSKIGSDVNRLLFEVLPSLAPGVFIHIHDVFHPFEYPRDWLEKGFFWNEAYVLRAFLQYNQQFKIEFFHDFMLKHHREHLLKEFPVLSWGQSIWLQRT